MVGPVLLGMLYERFIGSVSYGSRLYSLIIYQQVIWD